MLELAMTAFLPRDLPAIPLEHAQHISDLHSKLRTPGTAFAPDYEAGFSAHSHLHLSRLPGSAGVLAPPRLRRRKDLPVFYLRYAISELRRRKGRTIVTSLGLGIGVGLVVTVVALSNGLDEAQSKVLKPLTGVGTDMSVSRPLEVSGSGSDQTFQAGPGGPPQLSAKEQRQLRKENGGVQFGLQRLGDPGERFSDDNFITTDLSFPEKRATQVAAVDGVSDTAPALTLNLMHVSGKVPETSGTAQFGAPGAGGPPNSINFDQSTISGVDTSAPDLALVTPSQVIRGDYFSSGKNAKRQAVVSQSYANDNQLSVGDEIKVKDDQFKIVGIAQAPLGGQASDIYLRLGVLQKLSDREGRINVLRVRAESADQVESVADGIEQSFAGSKVTTAKDLADRVSGSLVDAKDLSNKLGTALAIVALAAAFLIAILLTLSSVSKRTRELGTLKALGWRQRLVVRQVTGESLAQGALGGLLGVAIGIVGAALITAFGPTLEATVPGAATGGPGGPPGLGAFGQGQITAGSSNISLTAPVDVSSLLLAIGLALLGGLLAGAIGASRAAHLRPAEALRSLE
jgi:ABC-type antimicrobial peptide transport system permease subunit